MALSLNPKVLSAPQGQQSNISVVKPQPLPSVKVQPLPTTPNLKITQAQPTQSIQVNPSSQQPKITSIGTTENQQPYTQKLTIPEFAQSIKQKYPEYQDRDDETLAKAMITKFPQYGDKVYVPPSPKGPGLLETIGKGIVSPFARLGKTAEYLSTSKALGGSGAGQTPAQINAGGFKPITTAKDAAGVGLELASYAVGGEGATGLAEAGLKGLIKRGAIQGLKTGAIGGALAGAGGSLQKDNTSVGRVALDTLKGAATGGLFGAILGGVGGAAGKVLPANRIISAQQKATKATQDLDTLAGKIVQGSTEDIAKAKAALSNINVSGIKTYKDLSGALDDQIGAIAGKLDQALETHPGSIPLDNLAVVKKVGNKSISHNYVEDALNQLDELYVKTNDPVNQAEIQQALEKAQAQGLSVREINDLARVYGQEFNDKAFSKISGDPLTSVNAQSFENTRSGIKETARNLFNNPVYNSADEELSNLIRTRQLVNNVAEKANQLRQKIQERGLLAKLGYKAGKVIDFATGSALKNFVNYFIPRGEGLKLLNALDLEQSLGKNLKILNKLLAKNVPDSVIIEELQKIIDTPAPKVRGLLSEPAISATGYPYNKPNLGSDFKVTNGPTIQQLQNTKMLPSGNGQGETIFQGTSDKSNSQILNAERFVYRDPKTGQMRRGYKATPK